jgi:hypothetical protein
VIALWILAAYVITSIYEYLGHRYAMHGRVRGLGEFFEKHVLHHGRFAPWSKWRAMDDPAGQWVGIDLDAPMMLVASSIIWGPVAFFSHAGAVTMALFFSLHGAAWSAIHREIHTPRGRWFAGTAYYRFVIRYHGRHHQRQGVNFNALCPLMDWVMGTFGGLLPEESLNTRAA